MREKYSDEKIKKILQSESIPEELEPENIKTMLDKFAVENRRKKTVKRRALKIIPIAAALVLTFSIAAPVYLKNHTDFNYANNPEDIVDNALEYQEVYDYFNLSELSFSFSDWLFGGKSKSSEDVIYEEAEADGETGMYNSSSFARATGEDNLSSDYYDTYNQEEGIQEADIAKTDGRYIYYASNNVINIAQAENGDFLSSSQITLNTSEYIEDLYLYNDYLIILSTIYNNYNNDDGFYDIGFADNTNTKISIYSLGNNINLVGNYVQEGSYNDVRMTSDGYLYLISNDSKYFDNVEFSADDIEYYIPKYSVNDDEIFVEPPCIVIPESENSDKYNYIAYTNISGFDFNSNTPYSPVDIKSIAGYSNNIYCSANNLYVTNGYYETNITRFSINKGEISPEVSGTVDGYVNDQFSMSEYDGYLRIAATIENYGESSDVLYKDGETASETQIYYTNCLYVLDMNLSVVGKVSNFGNDETIRSVNFNENMAYIVTYMQTDPLYAIDLSNPENPVVLDEFKINGFSTYMQRWSEDLLLGFGVNADENGIEIGLKLTMFDNSDPENLTAVSTEEINNSGYDIYVSSEAVWERKALIINSEKNIIGFPVSEYGDTVQHYYVFYSFDNNQLVSKGKIYADDESSTFNRAIIIGDYIYMLSEKQFKSADTASLTVTKSTLFN